MPLPRKLLGGYTITRHLLQADKVTDQAKNLVAQFADPGRPPVNEKEWSKFLATQLKIMRTLDEVQKEIAYCLDIARENGVIDAVETSRARQELLERTRSLCDQVEQDLLDAR